MTFSVDLTFDPPLTKEIKMDNSDYVHMRLESDSLECLKWMLSVIETTTDRDLYHSRVISYPIEGPQGEYIYEDQE